MRISVVIPTYNSAKTIGATLNSVLQQTVFPDEILVLDDGSTDDTLSLLHSYGGRVTVMQQKNQGVAVSRNVLAQKARGDLVAFLDHDDLWHPGYLEVQRRLFETYPVAVAYFVGHVNFNGVDEHEWRIDSESLKYQEELIEPLHFLQRYNEATGNFGSMSFCAVPKKVLTELGPEPFRISGVDDSYLCTMLPLLGPVVYTPAPLVAYRFLTDAQSADRLKSLSRWVNVFELLDGRYQQQDAKKLRPAFRVAFAGKRRWYGKLLMGAGKVPEARAQFLRAMTASRVPASILKSLSLFILTCLPAPWQPAWPSGDRALGDRMMNFNLNRRT